MNERMKGIEGKEDRKGGEKEERYGGALGRSESRTERKKAGGKD